MNLDPNDLAASTVILDQLPLELELKRIEELTRYQMCWLHRFAEAGHPYFQNGSPLAEAFKARYDKLGGMCPEISRQLDQLGHD